MEQTHPGYCLNYDKYIKIVLRFNPALAKDDIYSHYLCNNESTPKSKKVRK